MYLAFGLALLNNYSSMEVFASERVERELIEWYNFIMGKKVVSLLGFHKGEKGG